MKNNPKISIVVPAYKVQDYVLECLESIAAQTYKNIEVVVIDDGSPDDSGVICDDYAKKDARFHVIHQKNGGLSAARNRGLKEATGKYIAFVDSDDSVAPEYIEKLYQSIHDNDSELAVCGFNQTRVDREAMSGNEATAILLTRQLDEDLVAWNKLYLRSLFIDHKIAYPVGEIHEDNLTTYKLYAAAKRVSFVPDTLYNYRLRSDSITQSNSVLKQLTVRERASREAIEYFAQNEGLREAAEVALLLAKFRFIDCALSGKIDKKYYGEAREWVLENRGKYANNRHMTKKLKLYLPLLSAMGGAPYKMFRKIKK